MKGGGELEEGRNGLKLSLISFQQLERVYASEF